MLDEVATRVSRLGIALSADDDALDTLAAAGFDPVYGARPLRRTIQSAVEDSVAEKILEGTLHADDKVRLKEIDGKAVLIKEEITSEVPVSE